MKEVTLDVPVRSQAQVKCTVDIKVSGTNGKPYAQLSSDNISLSLFPSTPDPAKVNKEAKSRIKYNATVTLKDSGIVFQVPVKELTDKHENPERRGEIFAGEKSRFAEKRAVICDYDKDANDGQGASYERMSIPGDLFKTVMEMIRVCHEAFEANLIDEDDELSELVSG